MEDSNKPQVNKVETGKLRAAKPQATDTKGKLVPNAAAERSQRPVSQDPCIRAENEDDDGYDPYSDRRPSPEPLFERDPWS